MTIIEPIAAPGTLGSLSVGHPGGSTSNSARPWIGPALLPPLISFAILTGTSSLPTHLNLSGPPRIAIAQRSPTPELSSMLVSKKVEETLPDLARSVRSLRQRSGLTWDELARIFGVTRRTLYNWSIGSKVSAAHAQALAQVIARVHEIDAGDPKLTRSRLLAPTESGSTIYTRLAQRQAVTTTVQGPTYRPDQLLAAMHDTPDQTGTVVDFEPLN